ncbi:MULTISPECIES: hypothetical protein [Streptomyces]|uniref:hypothetical protein n=1 Tax=Streptomyces TaxID=1883 RepID=UPI00131D52F8|nr:MULTISPECIES: hypothetical protein [Streptomyces]
MRFPPTPGRARSVVTSHHNWRRIPLGCPYGVTTHDQGLVISEAWLLLPDM